MEHVVSAGTMKEYERGLIDGCSVPSLLLMERAALSVYSAMGEKLDSFGSGEKSILLLCGSGNNGADGLALARLLKEREDVKLRIVCVGERAHATEEWKTQAGILERLQLVIEDYAGEVPQCDIAVDAMLGIGLNRPLKETYEQAVKQLNTLHDKGTYVFAVDIPSGLHTDEGYPMPLCAHADETITFGARKRGMLLGEGRRYCGMVRMFPIGAVNEHMGNEYLLNWDDARKCIPQRDPLGHKGSFGKVLCICGSERMPGAAILNARAVLHTGAGMVKIVSPAANRDLLISAVPEAMYLPAEDCDEEQLKAELAWADALVLGCGLGVAADEWIAKKAIREWDKTVVVDADGLNALSRDMSFLKERAGSSLPTILTPHAGELARLFTKEDIKSVDRLRELAARYACVLVAKNATTLVTDGNSIYYNIHGNDGMATAGSGDVLAGIIGALSCVCSAAQEAACIGVSMHARCGALAASRVGNAALTASSLIDELSEVYK